ncbi:thioredoxin-dependent thiol peroxidase [Bifidobacterium oedipodis]|uniref:thioredoxin-dependent peroxiredoxin n=1 Tax=Bifidobacterium oedipodis TaxID=2675322 RepID=A0A7Y0EPX7_9BIFI|nr:thioredoxin-dependent thiol peroxidase [Bifidobacterium sp. DSM 109957]NMM93131.1 peroxiredoxin [Bifidobacterium sp. DSM 109957]
MSTIADTSHTADSQLPARLEPGQAAPDFALPADDGTTVRLSDVLAEGKRVIVYFYPAAMTPGCTKQACDFRDNLNRLTAAGYAVLGISKDSPEKLAKFRERDHLTFPLLSDPDLTVHKLYAAYGEKKLYGKTHIGVLRSTFVINTDGRLLLARYNVRATGHVDSLLKQLAKLD